MAVYYPVWLLNNGMDDTGSQYLATYFSTPDTTSGHNKFFGRVCMPYGFPYSNDRVAFKGFALYDDYRDRDWVMGKLGQTVNYASEIVPTLKPKYFGVVTQQVNVDEEGDSLGFINIWWFENSTPGLSPSCDGHLKFVSVYMYFGSQDGTKMTFTAVRHYLAGQVVQYPVNRNFVIPAYTLANLKYCCEHYAMLILPEPIGNDSCPIPRFSYNFPPPGYMVYMGWTPDGANLYVQGSPHSVDYSADQFDSTKIEIYYGATITTTNTQGLLGTASIKSMWSALIGVAPEGYAANPP